MKKMLSLLAFVALSLTTWAQVQKHDFKEGQFCYRINRDRPNEVSVAADDSYSSLSGELIIPSTVTHGGNTYTVTEIGDMAFNGCSGVTSVSIPSSIVTIGWEVFDGTALYNDPSNWVDNALYIDNCLFVVKPEQTGVYEIAEGTRVIGGEAFALCSSLTSITIPSSVVSIGDFSFYGCSSLTSIDIPSSVKHIGSYVFEKTVFYDDPSNWVDNVLYIDNCLIDTKRELEGDYEIAEGTRVIADDAFEGCSYLSSVSIPSSVLYIGTGVFNMTYKLTDIQVESGNPAYLSENGVLYNTDKTVLLHYPMEKKDDTLTIPSCMRSFGQDAFERCDYLTTIEWNAVNFQDFISSSNAPNCKYVSTLVFGEGVEHIPAYLCHYFSSLRSLTVSSTVTSVGQDAFAGCGNLSVYKNYSQLRLPDFLITSSPNLKELVSPVEGFVTISLENLTSITGLQSLTVHSSDKFDSSIYDRVLSFANLQQNTLTYIDIESLSPYNDIYIPDKCFLDFTLLETAKLPKELDIIGHRAFENCRMLQEITIPATVTEIDDSAFDNCRSLSAVHFGGSTEEQADDPAASQCALQRIGNWAFYNCHQLQELNIPEGVTEIGDAAFYGCSYLEDLVLPSSLQTIGDNCFSLCSKLGRIIVNAAVPPVVEAKTFYEVDRSIPVYVPKGSLEAYKADAYWSEFRLLDDDPATVLSPEADNSGCYAANGMLYNPNGVSLNVYNMQGVLIYTGNATKIEMPAKGIYILKTPTTTEKVVL